MRRQVSCPQCGWRAELEVSTPAGCGVLVGQDQACVYVDNQPVHRCRSSPPAAQPESRRRAP